MKLKNSNQHTNDVKLLENMGILADLLFQSGHIVVDSEWVDFSVEAVLKQKVRHIQEEANLSKRVETKYIIHCYRDEVFQTGERKILASSTGSSPIMAFECLNYEYAQPIMDRLRRQYQHLFLD